MTIVAPRLTTVDDVRRTAFHETGHAVAAVLFGEPFQYAKILADVGDERLDGALTGATNFRFLAPAPTLREVGVRVRVLLGSAIVECFQYGAPGRGCEGDYDKAIALKQKYEISDVVFCEWVADAENQLEAAWSSVAHIAEELYLRRSLDYSTVKSLVEDGLEGVPTGVSPPFPGLLDYWLAVGCA